MPLSVFLLPFGICTSTDDYVVCITLYYSSYDCPMGYYMETTATLKNVYTYSGLKRPVQTTQIVICIHFMCAISTATQTRISGFIKGFFSTIYLPQQNVEKKNFRAKDISLN